MSFTVFMPIAPKDSPSEVIARDSLFNAYIHSVYDSCNLDTQGLSYAIFEKAITGFYNIKDRSPKSILTIVDFQKPSKDKRLWVIDLAHTKVLFNTLVAHGKNTGDDQALKFSNTPNSYMSSLGFYSTGNTYIGKHGLSLVLEGLDEGFNSNAKNRAIVMHGADYVCKEFIDENGRLGRSLGCPALPPMEHKKIIEALEGGTILFVYHPSAEYRSTYLNRSSAIEQFVKENIQ